MNRITLYALISFVFSALSLTAQKNVDASGPVSFPDSVRVILEKTQKADAQNVATNFVSAWNNLRVDQQVMIQKQVGIMKKKKFPLRPHFVKYFGTIAGAVLNEKADASKISDFIRVAGLVIESESTAKALNFFSTSNTFFQHHALHY